MASIIQPGQFVFIDVSSTNTVATHDPTIAAVLVDRNDLTLITIGGQVNPLVGAAVDGRALRQSLGMRTDILLLGICAIDADEGLAAFYSEDAQMKVRCLTGRALEYVSTRQKL